MDLNSNKTLLQVTDRSVQIVAGESGAEAAIMLAHPHPFLRVTVNEHEARGRVDVAVGDHVKVDIQDTPVQREALVLVSSDSMTAELQIILESGVHRSLRPATPSRQVSLLVNEQKVEPEPFTITEIQQLLQDQKVTHNVDIPAVMQLIANSRGGKITVASGRPATEGEPEHYEIQVKASNSPVLVGIVPVHPVVTVLANTLVAQRIGRTEGMPGTNVRGDMILPKPMVSRLPKLGKGVQIDEDGAVRATRAGRLIVSPNLLDVAEVLTFEHDIGATNGYVVFDGDVVVNGSVGEGAEIIAGGRVFVKNMVSGAKIVADHGIVVNHGAFQANLQAGTRSVMYATLLDILDPIAKHLLNLLRSVETLDKAAQSRGVHVPVGQLAVKLIEDKFGDLVQKRKELETWRKQYGSAIGHEWDAFVHKVIQELAQSKIAVAQNTMLWTDFLQQIRHRIDEISGQDLTIANIEVKNAQNTTLSSTGNIMSTGQGFYQCKIQAGQTLQTQGSAGVILACEVTARNVEAHEIGSQAGTHTEILLSDKEGSVKAAFVHMGTMLRVDTWRHDVKRDMSNVVWP
jgi:hypothetical protein